MLFGLPFWPRLYGPHRLKPISFALDTWHFGLDLWSTSWTIHNLKEFSKSNMLQDHIWNALCSRSMFAVCSWSSRPYAFQMWSWSIFNLQYSSNLLTVQDHKVPNGPGPYGPMWTISRGQNVICQSKGYGLQTSAYNKEMVMVVITATGTDIKIWIVCNPFFNSQPNLNFRDFRYEASDSYDFGTRQMLEDRTGMGLLFPLIPKTYQ